MDICIRWVVALRPEAQALIDRFGLVSKKNSSDAFPVWVSEDGGMEVIVSGPGRVLSAAATGYLGGQTQGPPRCFGWINFGIAGSGKSDYGRSFIGNRICAAHSANAFYPPLVLPKTKAIDRRGIQTVDSPTTNYPKDGTLVEMEAAGFYPVASRLASSEFCQVLKVVSDDPFNDINSINKSQVINHCHNALDESSPWLDAFKALLGEEARRTADPEGFAELVSSYHFSVTQQLQLRRLLQQRQALGIRNVRTYRHGSDGNDCLRELREELKRAQLVARAGDDEYV
tara:strand:- start:9573 stop:10430 length:858 start_codon:yes stop_codon:yes gene_type:complete